MPFHRLLFSLAVLATLLVSVRGEEPFNFDSTPGKLPKEVVPETYAIRIVPDLTSRSFSGSEIIKLNVRQAVRELVLNLNEIEISKALLDGKQIAKSALAIEPNEQLLKIALDSELAAGRHELGLEFSGKINQAGQGLYFAEYQEHGSGQKKTMLGTQFEPADARRLFPCWDEPSFRAHFQLTVLIPENFTAVSNMPVAKEQIKAGRKEVTFVETPLMSSYLNVFVAGELDAIEATDRGVKHRVDATKGKSKMGSYALESSQQILNYYNDYFGVPYPLPKLDQIAVPGGFGGAMENWGGITYYESRLLFDPAISSAQTKQGIYEVLAHEMAHQWFGDLVTMAWWDNLWLNEGFASWMGSKCTAKFHPEWEVWLEKGVPRDPTRRYGIPKEAAMEGDARSTTHPIQQVIKTEAEANSAFDDITYKKGQSFIRMIESFLGEDVFREGIRKYIAAHKFSNSTTADLWSALAESSGKPVAAIAAGWTQQPGFPIVKVQRQPDGKVLLTQERFTINFPDAPQLQWQIPITYSIAGEATPKSLLMTDKTVELGEIPVGRSLKLNVDGAGNYRVQYDDTSWKLLLSDLTKLSVPDRVNLLADDWALVQANRVPFSHYLNLVDQLQLNALAEYEQFINVADFANRLLDGEPTRDSFQKYARGKLSPELEKLGWQPKQGEPQTVGLLRASLIEALGDLNTPEVVAGCRERFHAFLTKPSTLAPDLRPAVLGVVGRHADEGTWKTLHDLGLKTTSTEEKQNYYDALAGARDPKLAAQTLNISLTNQLPSSRALAIVAKVGRESGRPEIAWEFAKEHMKDLLAKADALGANSFAPSLFTFFSDTARISEMESYARASLSPEASAAVAKAVDEIAFRAELRTRLNSQLTIR